MISSVQSSASALIALENLSNSPAAGAESAPQTGQAAQPSESPQPAAVVDAAAADAAAGAGGVDANLGGAAQIADAAVSAGGAVADLLAQMQQAAIGASDPSLGQGARSALNDSYQSDLAQIQATVGQASANGVNLLDGSAAGALQLPGDGGTTVTLSAANLSLGGPVIGPAAAANLLDPTSAAAAAGAVAGALASVTQIVGQISGQGQAIETHLSVIAQASLPTASALAGGLNPGLDQDGARLQALQVQQQLLAGGVAVANQSPQSILALFR
jgi:flagellin